jgi:DNA-binding response OmpR family regulator
MNILAVDDEKDTRCFLRDFLTHAGHHVITASCALDAMLRVQTEPIDLALVDLMMSGIDGNQFAQFMSSQWNTFEIPVIMVSSRKDNEAKSWARICGCARYLEKPFSPAELLDAIRDFDHGQGEEAPLLPR